MLCDAARRLHAADLKRFQQGDHAFFRSLVDACSPRLLALARSFARDSDEACDLVQTTWLRVYEKRLSYRGEGTLIGWILSVARSVCVDEARSRAAEAIRPTAATVGDELPDALVTVEQAGMARALRLALLQLPDRERDVVWLRYIEQCSTRETAARMCCAEGTVKAALYHAMRKLQEAMNAWAM